MRRAQQEAARHLALAVQSFQPFDAAGVAGAHATLAARGLLSDSRPVSDTTTMGEGEGEGDDAELGYSEDEGCPEADLAAADSDSSDGSEDGDAAMDVE